MITNEKSKISTNYIIDMLRRLYDLTGDNFPAKELICKIISTIASNKIIPLDPVESIKFCPIPPKEYGKMIKKTMEEKNLTVEELAKLIDLSPSYLHKYIDYLEENNDYYQ
jgi:hypothetical protein